MAAAFSSADKPPAASGAVKWQDIPSWAAVLAAEAKAKSAGAAAGAADAKPTAVADAKAADAKAAGEAAAAAAPSAAAAGAGAGAGARAAAASAGAAAPPGGAALASPDADAAAAAARAAAARAAAAPTNDELNSKVCVWRGDITRLQVDAIMNAANEPLGGCGIPGHCIDSAICLAAGPQLVEASSALGPIGPGECRITAGFKLLCPWVVHVVGPRCGVAGTPHRFDRHTQQYVPVGPIMADERPVELRAGYIGSLDLCRLNALPPNSAPIRTFALCCLSTGMFGYAKEPAGHVAMQAVRDWLSDAHNFASVDRIIFCTFDAGNTALYHQLMPKYFPPNGTKPLVDASHLAPAAVGAAAAAKKAQRF